MSVLSSLNELVATLGEQSPQVSVLVESARALASEIDAASVPDDNGRTKSAASAVRELRAVVDELMTKGSVHADDADDWSSPVADLAKVRNGAGRKSADARPRGRGGGQAAG